MPGFSIGQLAKSADVSIDTIRFYEKAGLLRPRVRRPSGFREYSQLNLKQLKFIRCGRQLGFSLEEIAQLLSLEGEQVSTASALIRQKLRMIDWKIEELHRWRSCLFEFISRDAGSAPEGQSILDCFTDGPAGAHADALGPYPPQGPSSESNDED